jgi:hypothetical protein
VASALEFAQSFAAAATIGAPHLARAQAKTATVWWIQGFAQEEERAFHTLVSEYQRASGNNIDATVIPYAPARQKKIIDLARTNLW